MVKLNEVKCKALGAQCSRATQATNNTADSSFNSNKKCQTKSDKFY